MPHLVHSLWANLWKPEFFSRNVAADLRKHYPDCVDKRLFSTAFIHNRRVADAPFIGTGALL
jgi:hypothetical protein